MELTIGTFNIQHGINYPEYLATGNSVVDLELFSEGIRQFAPDICGLNEIYGAHWEMGNQARQLGEYTGLHHIFARALEIHNGDYGNALLSRVPAQSYHITPIRIAKEDRKYRGYYEDRVLLTADFEIEGQPLTVMVCHFGLNPDEVEKAVETLWQEQKKIRHPLVFIGDLNICPGTESYHRITGFLQDAAGGCSDPLNTYPSNAPECKIDHIFVNEFCRVKQIYVPDVRCSDHLPLVARIAF